MNNLSYVILSLKQRLFNTSLSLILIIFGVFIALVLSQINNHFNKRLNSDGKNIDMVIGAKGSPLQLVLSSVYHIDIPTGNISYDLVKNYTNHPQIKNAIPLALGDNWRGFRIVGTTLDYIDHYSAKIDEGRRWKENFEVLAGASIKVDIGDVFYGSHGLLNSDSTHDDTQYKIVGILEPTGTVIDRLLLTPLDSVLAIHGHSEIGELNKTHLHDEIKHQEEKHFHSETKHIKKEHEHLNVSKDNKKHLHEEHEHEDYTNIDVVDVNVNKLKTTEEKFSEITAVLITTKSPIANINLPRLINKESSMQAANPALEIVRLTSIFGLSSKSLTIFSSILISISILSIFIGLVSNLEHRMGELAILRAIGYSKNKIFYIIVLEGMLIVGIGLTMGIIIGIIGFEMLTEIIIPLNTIQANFEFNLSFFLIISSIFVSGYFAAIIPALKASKINVAHQLTKNT